MSLYHIEQRNGRWELFPTKRSWVSYFDTEQEAKRMKRCRELEFTGMPVEQAVAQAKREFPLDA